MDKYEYKQLSERMIELMQNEEYGEAKEIADSIDWRRVRNAMMLANVSDIYEKTGEYQKSYDILQIAYHRAEGSRKVLYRLSSLALKTGNVVSTKRSEQTYSEIPDLTGTAGSVRAAD